MSPALPEAFDPQHLARQLTTASTRQPAASFAVPTTIAEAMAVQDAVVGPATSDLVGYKVAISPDGIAVRGRLSPLMTTNAEAPAAFPWRDGARIEIEIAVKLATALPPREEGYSRNEVIDAVGTVYLGVEILDSRIEDAANAPYLLSLADRLGNGGYAVGRSLPKSALDAAEDSMLDISLGQTVLYAARAHHPAGDVLAWLVAYASNAARPQETLSAGVIVTAGSLCGALTLGGPGLVRAQLAGFGDIHVSLEG